MSTIVTRATKGAPLTHAEVDANFTNLNTDKLQGSGALTAGYLLRGAGTNVAGPSAQVFDDGTNVAIGHTSPAAKFDVLTSAGRLLLSYNGSANFISSVNAANSAYADLQINGNTVAIFTGGAQRAIFSGTNFGFGTGAWGTSAVNVISIANGVAPSTSPAGIGQLFVESGALKFRGSSGTVTTIAPA